MWAHPGKQLVFMGAELAQDREWSESRSLDWHLLDDAGHRGVQELVRAMNAIYRDEPALWERDFVPEGFRWIDANDSENSVLAFLRVSGRGDRVLVCVANLTPVPRLDYRIGLPKAGTWDVVLNSDSAFFGGGNVGPCAVEASPTACHGLDASASVDLPPLGVLWLRPASV
jgi:1,4-alpha-glucan branching enzyme